MMITLTDRAAIPDAEAAALASTQSITFKEAAARYIAVHRKGLRTPSTRHNGGRPSPPILDKVLVRNIDVAHVHRVLEPTWTAKARDRQQSAWTHREIPGWAQLALSDKSLWLATSGCDRSAISGLRFASSA